MQSLHRSLALALVAVSAGGPVAAQEILDRGVFVVTRGGAETGREEFVIQTSTGRGGVAGVRAVSAVHLPGRDIEQVIELAADYAPLSYQQTITAGGRVASRVSAQVAGIRFSARVTSADGETAREFPVRPPLVILADDAWSTYYFVPRPTSGTPRALSVVRPSDLRPVAATVDAAGDDTVLVGTQRIGARQFVLRIAGGDERRFWMSPTGDLLQVAAGDRLATRAEPPRR